MIEGVFGAASLRERRSRAGPFPVLRVAEWESAHPGLVAGTTALELGDTEGSRDRVGERQTPPHDFRLDSPEGVPAVLERYLLLARHLGFDAAAVPRQVHGTRVVWVSGTRIDGVEVPAGADGLLSRTPGVLLAVTVADCVPVYVVEPSRGLASLVHAGWRGTAARVLREAVGALERDAGAPATDLLMHLGPAICGRCYEVGPEVLAALGYRDSLPRPVDLRSELEREAISLGLRRERISRSELCTRCGPEPLHSHRGRGIQSGRQAAFLGWSHHGGLQRRAM